MHDHPDVAALAAPFAGMADAAVLLLPLFLAGLLGGLTHCAGMCGPFVMAQVGARLERVDGQAFGGWPRLRIASLLPYHFGRLTTYALLGAIGGGLGSLLVDAVELRWPRALLLLAGAGLLAVQAIGWHVLPRLGWLETLVSPVARRLVGHPDAARGYALGLTLGFLPCGLLYGALATAAASGTAAGGAAAMAAFALGTMPALVAVGWGGAVFGVRRRERVRQWTRPLLILNSVVLAVLAVRALA